jgi:uncharacterized protein (TIGR04255 family)
MASEDFRMDLNESFPHLAAAPIVEAVIYWQARAEQPWEPGDLRAKLAERLPEYPNQEFQHLIEFAVQGVMAVNKSHATASPRSGWHGIRISTPDRLYIAQFTRDGFAFSRMHPYNEWASFSTEARRLWRIFVELATPSEVQRLAVRFINRIATATLDNLGDYLKEPPTCPGSLPLSSFVYQSTFKVPDHPFEISVVKMMQPATSVLPQGPGLILDITVITSGPIACDEHVLDRVLPEMRWLKNRIFFELLTEKAIHSFQGELTMLTCWPTPAFSDEAKIVAEATHMERRLLTHTNAPLGKRPLFDELATVWEECRHPNWDGYGAQPVSQDTLRHAYVLIESLPLGCPAPSIGAEPEGELTLEWYRSPRRALSVSVTPYGELYFAALLGPNRFYGTEAHFGEIPERILDLISQVYRA